MLIPVNWISSLQGVVVGNIKLAELMSSDFVCVLLPGVDVYTRSWESDRSLEGFRVRYQYAVLYTYHILLLLFRILTSGRSGYSHGMRDREGKEKMSYSAWMASRNWPTENTQAEYERKHLWCRLGLIKRMPRFEFQKRPKVFFGQKGEKRI
jgi:hypothetical protein